MFIPIIADRYIVTRQCEKVMIKYLRESVTTLSGVCLGMQNMQTFVSACGHLLRALCLHALKEKDRQTECRQLRLLNQCKRARPRPKVRGHAASTASWSPIQWHRCHTMSVNSHWKRASAALLAPRRWRLQPAQLAGENRGRGTLPG